MSPVSAALAFMNMQRRKLLGMFSAPPAISPRQRVVKMPAHRVTGPRKQLLTPRVLVHGTLTGYRYGCRCARCKAGEQQYRAQLAVRKWEQVTR